jgi:hypothetical protein
MRTSMPSHSHQIIVVGSQTDETGAREDTPLDERAAIHVDNQSWTIPTQCLPCLHVCLVLFGPHFLGCDAARVDVSVGERGCGCVRACVILSMIWAVIPTGECVYYDC